MKEDQHIIRFVRHTLGCTCPDEVFDEIVFQAGDDHEGTYTRSIILGGRLLIYIWETNDPSLVQARLPAILVRGKNERDQRGLNRFRAVIATDDAERIGSTAQQLFQALPDKDEKVHLHVVRRNDVPRWEER